MRSILTAFFNQLRYATQYRICLEISGSSNSLLYEIVIEHLALQKNVFEIIYRNNLEIFRQFEEGREEIVIHKVLWLGWNVGWPLYTRYPATITTMVEAKNSVRCSWEKYHMLDTWCSTNFAEYNLVISPTVWTSHWMIFICLCG